MCIGNNSRYFRDVFTCQGCIQQSRVLSGVGDTDPRAGLLGPHRHLFVLTGLERTDPAPCADATGCVREWTPPLELRERSSEQ